jgi:hypothetical protein
LDAYREEELYGIITYCIQNPNASDFELKKQRTQEIGKELYADCGVDAMENSFYPIEFRVREKMANMLGHIVQGAMI